MSTTSNDIRSTIKSRSFPQFLKPNPLQKGEGVKPFVVELNVLKTYPDRDIFYAKVGTHVEVDKEYESDDMLIKPIFKRMCIFAVVPSFEGWSFLEECLGVNIDALFIIQESVTSRRLRIYREKQNTVNEENLKLESVKQDIFFRTKEFEYGMSLKSTDIPYPSEMWLDRQASTTGPVKCMRMISKRWNPEVFMKRYSQYINDTEFYKILKTLKERYELFQKILSMYIGRCR